MKTEVKQYKYKWRKCIAINLQEADEKDKAPIDKLLNEGRTDN